VDSKIGHGTTFHIYVPCAQPTLQNHPVQPFVPDAVLAGEETILLVEDEEQIRVLAGIALQEAGYSTLIAANGQEALALARQHKGPIHLVLTDVIMPGMNGVKLSEEVDALYPAIKTLYISGYADSKLTFPLLESTGRTAYLPKPFTPGLLTQKVREVLDLTLSQPNGATI
jgi:DNA-binding NtrC family response regulator